ncbi:MAG: hypothetical protein K2J14_06070, partial [Treponemataceae bacterium]|nr:hypothetical protein [Treponemataceae bacterium]
FQFWRFSCKNSPFLRKNPASCEKISAFFRKKYGVFSPKTRRKILKTRRIFLKYAVFFAQSLNSHAFPRAKENVGQSRRNTIRQHRMMQNK